MGYYPQESLYKPYKYHGYTVRGYTQLSLDIHHAPSKRTIQWAEKTSTIQRPVGVWFTPPLASERSLSRILTPERVQILFFFSQLAVEDCFFVFFWLDFFFNKQTFQVPKMEESSPFLELYVMDTAYVRESPFKVQETLHFRCLKVLVIFHPTLP